MYFFARTKNVAIVKTKFEWDMSNCIAMYTSHLLYFTYSIKINIIITGKHVLNETPPYLTVKGLYYTLPKKLFTCKNTAVDSLHSNIVPYRSRQQMG